MINKCILCNSQDIVSFEAQFAPFLQERMFNGNDVETNLIHCLDCDFYFSSYRPTDEEMEKLYTGYRNSNYQKQRQKYEPLYTEKFNNSLSDYNQERYIAIERFLDKHIDPQEIINVLDYGGDRGQYIPKKYFNRFVYDISNTVTEVNVKNITKKDLLSVHWNLIMCCHVLEHLSDPNALVYELEKMLPVGSFLYVEVPFDKNSDFLTENYWAGIHEHINFFRLKTISELFKSKKEFSIIDTMQDPPQSGSPIRILVKKHSNIADNQIIFLLKIKPKRKRYSKSNC